MARCVDRAEGRGPGALGPILVCFVLSMSVMARHVVRAEGRGVAEGQATASAAANPDLHTVLRSYLEAVEREDIDRVDAAWSLRATDREAVLRGLRSTWRALDYRFDNIQVLVLSADDSAARVRVSAIRRESGLAPEPRATSWSRVFDLALTEGVWRIVAERTAVEVLAEAMVVAPSADDRARLMRESQDLVGPELGEALMRVADREHIERRLDEALVGYSTIIELGDRVGDAALEVGALQNLGNIHYVRQEFDRALTMYERRLVIEEARRNVRGTVVALQAMASAHYASSRYDLAQRAYERLVDLERKVGTRASVASTLANLGNVHYLQGSFELALGCYKEALALQVQLANEEEQARLEFGVGRALTALGAFAPALVSHRSALARREHLGSRAEQAASLQEIGRVQFLQGALTASLQAYDHAAAVETEIDNPAGLGRILLSKGLVFSTQGRFDEALAAYRGSIASFERAGEIASTGYGWLGAASVVLEVGRPDAALVDYHKSAEVFEAHNDGVGVSRALVGMSIAHVERRAFQTAIETASRAAGLARQAGALESWWQAEYQRGRALWFLGQRAEARAAYEAAVALIDEARDESASRNDEGRTLADRVAPFTALVELHARAGDAMTALVAAEEQKRRVLEELVHEHRWRLLGDLSAEEAAEERRLTGQLVTTSQQRRRARARVPQVAEVVAALDRRVADDRTALRAFDDRLSAHHAWRASRARRRVSAEDVSALVRPGRVLVEFVVGDLESFVMAVRGRDDGEPEVRVHPIAVARRELTAQVGAFEALLRQDSLAHDAGSALFNSLFGPILQALDGARELVIVPDGPLWLLSFPALPTVEGAPLIERVAIQLTPALLQSPVPNAPSEPTPSNAPEGQPGPVGSDAAPVGARLEATSIEMTSMNTTSLAEKARAEASFAAAPQDPAPLAASDPATRPVEAPAGSPSTADGTSFPQQTVVNVETLTTAERLEGSLLVRGRLTLNDASPFHGTLDAQAAEDLAAGSSAAALERSPEGAAELRAVLSARGVASVAVVAALESAREPNEGAGLLGAVWALGVAGARSVIWRRCDGAGCDDQRAIEALADAWTGAASPAVAVQTAVKRMRASSTPPPPSVWGSLAVAGSVHE